MYCSCRHDHAKDPNASAPIRVAKPSLVPWAWLRGMAKPFQCVSASVGSVYRNCPLVVYYLCFNKESLPEGYCKTATLISHTAQAVVAHTFNPSSHTS